MLDCPQEATAAGGKLCGDHSRDREERARGGYGLAGRKPRLPAAVDPAMYQPRVPAYGVDPVYGVGGGYGYGAAPEVPGGGMVWPGPGHQDGSWRTRYHF